MLQNQPVWLPHLPSEVVADARGYELDAYVIALEGWRRGLTLRWHTKDSEKFPEMKTWFVDKPGKLFSLSSQERTHYFFRTRGDKVSNEAVEIGADKEKTKHWLSKAGVPVPEGRRFGEDIHDDEIVHYASTIGFPVVLKPTDGSFGRGVVTDIQDEDALQKALIQLRSEQNYTDVIVERFIPGEEYRLYVVENKVVGAMNRIPAHVIGDGTNNIFSLIEQENQKREENPRLISCLINIDQEIKDHVAEAGYTFESIPEKGERIFLRGISNISLGGNPVDVLDRLPNPVKTTAVQALQAIPDLHHGAVDLIVDQYKPVEEASVVIELNPTAQIGSLLFPMQGHARDIPAAIIDYYFPETIEQDKKGTNSNIYFGFKQVIRPLVNKAALNVTVPPYPTGEVFSRKYIVSGSIQGGYLRWIQKQAFLQKLSGYTKKLENGDVEIVVAGVDNDIIEQFKDICSEGHEKSEVRDITEEVWGKPVKVGFEIIKETVHSQKLEAALSKEMDELKKLTKERKRAQKRYENMMQSPVWRYTLPLRKLLDRLKGLKKA